MHVSYIVFAEDFRYTHALFDGSTSTANRRHSDRVTREPLSAGRCEMSLCFWETIPPSVHFIGRNLPVGRWNTPWSRCMIVFMRFSHARRKLPCATMAIQTGGEGSHRLDNRIMLLWESAHPDSYLGNWNILKGGFQNGTGAFLGNNHQPSKQVDGILRRCALQTMEHQGGSRAHEASQTSSVPPSGILPLLARFPPFDVRFCSDRGLYPSPNRRRRRSRVLCIIERKCLEDAQNIYKLGAYGAGLVQRWRFDQHGSRHDGSSTWDSICEAFWHPSALRQHRGEQPFDRDEAFRLVGRVRCRCPEDLYRSTSLI